MPITRDDIENITSDELKALKESLGLKTQADIDKAYGTGKAAGEAAAKEKIAEAKSIKEEYETLKAEKAKLESEATINKKILELKLDLTEEDKNKILDLAGGDVEKISQLAEFIVGKKAPDAPADPFKGNVQDNTNNPGQPNQNPDIKAKDASGNYIDPDMAAMAKNF